MHAEAIDPPVLRPLKPERGELLHLDFARFVAAMGIMVAHSIEFITPAVDRINLRAQGFSAGLPLFVDLFFVVSGFVIAYVYSDRMHSLRDYGVFLQRRVGRLVPLHLLLFLFWWLFWAMVAGLRMPMTHHFSLSPSCLATTAFLLISFVDCGGASVNGITWSISAEMAMYVAFPIVALLTKSRWLLVLTAAVLFGYALFQFGGLSDWTQESVWRAPPAFLFGAFLFTIRATLAKLPAASIWLCIALALLSVGGMLNWPKLILLPIAYAAPALAVAADGRPVPLWIRRVAPLGQLTYSIYMLHPVLITLILNGLADKRLHLSAPAMIAATFVTYSLILLLSWASYRLYESPMRRWIDSRDLFGGSARRSKHASY